MVNNMIARQVGSLIVASCMHSDADYLKLSERLPVVLFDRFPSDSALPLVMTDSVTPAAGRSPASPSACGRVPGFSAASRSYRLRATGWRDSPKAWLRRGYAASRMGDQRQLSPQLRLDVRRALRAG